MITAGQLLALIAGIVIHFLAQVVTARNNGNQITLLGYWTLYPYQSAISIIGSGLMFAFQWETGQLTFTSAAMTGMVGNEIVDRLTKRAKLMEK